MKKNLRLWPRKMGINGKGISFLCFLTYFIMATSCTSKFKIADHLFFYLDTAPTTFDPLMYDFFINHVGQRSINASLTTNYSKSGITGQLASSWKDSDNQKKWIFQIRDNIFFSNGDPITSKIIAASLKRMAFLLKKENSNEGFLNLLVGISKLKDLSGQIDGITFDQSSLTLAFTQPVKDVPLKISFGLYAIIHPSSYDQLTGKWKQKNSIPITSGIYQVKSHSKENIQLTLNPHNVLSIGHKDKFSKITIFWNNGYLKNIDKETAFMQDGTELETPLLDNLTFLGGGKSGILYSRIYSWSHPKSIFHHKKYRYWFRNKFYTYLKDLGYTPTISFFPTELSGVKEIDIYTKQEQKPNSSNFNIIHKPFSNDNLKINHLLRKAYNSLSFRNSKISEKMPKNYHEVVNLLTPHNTNYSIDLGVHITGILLSDPENDIQFMFKSSQGIRLPDENGKILRLLDGPKLDIQAINQELIDQGIIWPITHFRSGYFYTEKLIDTSLYNNILPPIDFTWIGRK